MRKGSPPCSIEYTPRRRPTRGTTSRKQSEQRTKRAARAKRLAAEGALSKAVQGMDGGTRDLDKGQQMMYGRMLLPQSSHANPMAEQNQQMTGDDEDNNSTPRPPLNTQATQNDDLGNDPGNSQGGQN
eukprot:7522183-Heterocapsa_arctica.AAC.1